MAEPEDQATAAQSRGEDSKGIEAREGGFLGAAAARLRASGRLGWAVFAAGVVGGIVLIVAELSKVIYITVVTASC